MTNPWLCRAERMQETITRWYQDLHQCPELELHCPQTAQYLCAQLQALGIPYRTYPGHSGITALIGKPGGKVAAIRSDMDGLAIEEETGLPYASRNGNMHACGHDAHMAVALGCAAILKEMEEELPGQVKLIFQPGEEPLAGAKVMIAGGALEDPRPDRLFILHVGALTSRHLPVGSVVVPRQHAFASSDVMRLTILGKGGHAAVPHLLVSPILAAARVVENLQTIIQRDVPPGHPAVLSITSLMAGNGRSNVVPDTAEIILGFRALDAETRALLHQRIIQVAQETAQASGTRAEAEHVVGCAPAVNDLACAQAFMASAQKVLPSESLHWMEERNFGGEDASYMMEQIPSVYFFLQNCLPARDGVVYPHHNSKFQIDPSVLHYGTALYLQAIQDFFAQDQ